jgi:hypothetical protein
MVIYSGTELYKHTNQQAWSQSTAAQFYLSQEHTVQMKTRHSCKQKNRYLKLHEYRIILFLISTYHTASAQRDGEFESYFKRIIH